MTYIRKYLGALAMLGLMATVACSKEEQEPTPTFSTIRQIDVAEVLPVHESSLEYLDYVLTYSDNIGQV